jgi:hypothetical protein
LSFRVRLRAARNLDGSITLIPGKQFFRHMA